MTKTLFAATLGCLLLPLACAQHLVEYQFRGALSTRPRRAAGGLATYLPAGFTSNIAAQGAAKDCNLRAVFIDRMTINGPDGKPVGKGPNRLVYLVAPVKDRSGANAQLVIGGITEDPADAPGPFGVYLPGTTHSMQRTIANAAESQDWVFRAAGGEHLEMHIKFERGVGNRTNPTDTRFYSAKMPGFFQISREEQVLDILGNVTTTPANRVKEFSFKGYGGSYARLFDGSEKVLSWDDIVWINRSVLLP